MHRDWVIPDIHGCDKTLKALIEQKVQPSNSDRLFFLGDYIDRGPRSKQVIDYLILMKESGLQMNFLKGNHEDFCILAYDEFKNEKKRLFKDGDIFKKWKNYGGKDTLKSFGIKSMKNFPKKYYDWMTSLDYYYELENHFLVHAGFDFFKEDMFSDTEAMMWLSRFEVKPERVNNKKVVYGHVPVSLDHIEYCIDKNKYTRIPLDNGVYKKEKGFGNLVAFDLISRKLEVQPNLDF